MDFSQVRINCTRLAAIMTEPKNSLTDKMFERLEYLKGKASLTEKQNLERIELQFRMDNYDPLALSKSATSYLMFLYQYLKYGKRYQIGTKKMPSQMLKGIQREKASLQLINKVTGQQYRRYKSPIKNEYLKGQLDVINGQTLDTSTKIIDIKTSFSHSDFMKKVQAEVIRHDNFQMQGYFALTGKERGEVYYCLTDFTDEDIEREKMALAEILCPDGILTDYFMEEWASIENSMRFTHVPDEERVIVFEYERDDKLIEKIYEKVQFCREWLQQFEAIHLLKIATQNKKWFNDSFST